MEPRLDHVPGVERLYIGGSISMRRREALRKANVTHVVTALRPPLEYQLYTNYEHLPVEVDDLENEDILQHFGRSNVFIRDGLANGGGVLVHCAMGKSRAATLIVAYLLSQSPESSVISILESLRTSRSTAEPNPGFMEQLELFRAMGAPDDVSTQPAYQRWLFQQEIKASNARGIAPDSIRFEDENGSEIPQKIGAANGSIKSETELRCRKCRRALATSTYILPHDPDTWSNTHGASPTEAAPASVIASAAMSPTSAPVAVASRVGPAPAVCSHLFLDPLSWMGPQLEQGHLDGRLVCPNPKCKSVIGKYAWQGLRCSCNRWVVPGISLARARVDEVKRAAGSAASA